MVLPHGKQSMWLLWLLFNAINQPILPLGSGATGDLLTSHNVSGEILLLLPLLLHKEEMNIALLEGTDGHLD